MAFFVAARSGLRGLPELAHPADQRQHRGPGNDPRHAIEQRRHQPRHPACALADRLDPMMHHRHAMGENPAAYTVAMYTDMDTTKSFKFSILKTPSRVHMDITKMDIPTSNPLLSGSSAAQLGRPCIIGQTPVEPRITR